MHTSLAAIAVLAVIAAATTGAGGLLLVVLERVGTPAGLLGAIAAGAALILACGAGLASGTVRFRRFVTGGRGLPGAAASMALAVSWPLACPGVPAAAAVLGFAVIAGVAVVVLAIIFAFKAKAWIAGLFGHRPPAESPPPREMRQVTDVQYEIVEKRDDRP